MYIPVGDEALGVDDAVPGDVRAVEAGVGVGGGEAFETGADLARALGWWGL
jgi:hypothetical protein